MNKFLLSFLLVFYLLTVHVSLAGWAEEAQQEVSAVGDIEDDYYADDYADDYLTQTAEVCDPFEPVNRGIYAFNEVVDAVVLRPVAVVYRNLVPAWGRERISNFLYNLLEPVNFVNALLQGDMRNSMTVFWRFMINSSLGIGGLFDIAAIEGLERQPEDFGQTLGHYGVGNGFYMVLPVLGPTTLRDFTGRVVDVFTDPFVYMVDDEVSYIRAGVTLVDRREQLIEFLDDVNKTAIDPYSTIKSVYIQSRRDMIDNGANGVVP